jgi:hypothetical protein
MPELDDDFDYALGRMERRHALTTDPRVKAALRDTAEVQRLTSRLVDAASVCTVVRGSAATQAVAWGASAWLLRRGSRASRLQASRGILVGGAVMRITRASHATRGSLRERAGAAPTASFRIGLGVDVVTH